MFEMYDVHIRGDVHHHASDLHVGGEDLGRCASRMRFADCQKTQLWFHSHIDRTSQANIHLIYKHSYVLTLSRAETPSVSSGPFFYPSPFQ
jgi:hypothetical protein